MTCLPITDPIRDMLSIEYQARLAAEKLPQMSADELLHETLTHEQRLYVSAFLNQWDDIEAAETAGELLRLAGFVYEFPGYYQKPYASGALVGFSGSDGSGDPSPDDWMVCFYPPGWDGENLDYDIRSTSGGSTLTDALCGAAKLAIAAPPLPQWALEHGADYIADVAPLIPADWTDRSWHNDAMPFFLASPSVGVWIDAADADQSDWSDGRKSGATKRFMVVRMEDGGIDGPQHSDAANAMVGETDDWQELLAMVASAAAEPFVPQCDSAPAHRDTGRGVCASCGQFLPA
jgi:hypothetical protein